MTHKHVPLFLLLICSHVLFAQSMKPASSQLRIRLLKYAADNHLQPNETYMFWDSATQKPVRFQAGSFLTDEAFTETVATTIPKPLAGNNSLTGGISNFHLVKDVNTASESNPSLYQSNNYTPVPQYAVLNNVAYFTADDGIHGIELWRSDGTTAGTYLLKDITAGEASSYIYNLYATAGKLYFSVRDETNYSWQVFVWNDASQTLTSLLPGSYWAYAAENFCDVNGTVYFTANYGSALYKTDGTVAGTLQVSNFSAAGVNRLYYLTAYNGILYFSASSNNNGGSFLYRSNGTAAGTYVVQSFPYYAYYDEPPSQLTVYNNLLYFVAKDGSGFSTLWVCNGTTAGAVAGNNGVTVSTGTYTYTYNPHLIISNNVLYFNGYTSATGAELYKYDAASGEGIRLVKDNLPGSSGYFIYFYNMSELNGFVYFMQGDLSGIIHLYKTDGTAAGTTSVKDFPAGASASNLYSLNGKLYFTGSEQNTNYEPWVSDGTASGTIRLSDVYPGSSGSSPSFFTAVNGKVLFSAMDDVHGREPFVTDGAHAQLLKDINTTTTSGSQPYNITAYQGGVLLSAYTNAIGSELYKASSTGETLVSDIIIGQPSCNPQNIVVKNNVAYFSATTSVTTYSKSIYKTDGTFAGTQKLTPDFRGYVNNITVTDNGSIFYFIYNSQTFQYQLWKTDAAAGSNALLGTFNGFDVYNYYNNTTNVATIGNTIYFSAATNQYGTELFKSDGTAQGTGIAADININAGSGSYPSSLTVYNNQLYFSADDGSGTALWKSDGSAGGTSKLANVSPSLLTVSGNGLFFSGTNNVTGTQLWKTDGTIEGTVLIEDVLPGTRSSFLSNLIDVNGTLFFTAVDSVYNYRLYKSNSTSANTQYIASLADVYPDHFVTAAGRLFFSVSNRLWGSDGTAGGTGAINDAIAANLTVYDIKTSGDKLFLSAYTYQYGNELYTSDASQVVLPVTLLSFDASLQGSDVLSRWQTSSEINTSHFIVQRSTDGVHFSDAGKVMPKGSRLYTYTDANIANILSVKTVYYRLQTTDNDGSTSLSKTVAVNVPVKEAVAFLLPNPVNDELKIRLHGYSGNAAISVFDINGKMMWSTQKSVLSGSDVTFNASSLQKGLYIVKISLAGKTTEQKFMKE